MTQPFRALLYGSMSLREYVVQIGFGYLAIPVITLLVGKVLEQKT